MDNENSALVEINKAQRALEAANDIHEVLDLRDQFMAMQVFANAQGFKDAAQEAKIYQLKAERKAGEWLEKNVSKGGDFTSPSQDGRSLPDGIDWHESSRWQQEAKIPEPVFNDWIDDCLSTGKEITASGLQRIGRELNKDNDPPKLPTDKFRVIYADPPWKYGNTMPNYMGVQDDHYQLMDLDAICALPVRSIAEDNAVLFLWVTSPILEESFQVIKSWGFEYKASFIWDKIKHVMGHYNSVRHEFLLICVRGSCPPDEGKLFDSVQSIERTEHSVKPDKFREIIETLYPYGKKIELFAREQIEGWVTYGNELPSALS